jgi:ERCC4-type nuclease
MNLIIDNREKVLKQYFLNKTKEEINEVKNIQLNITFENLELGDIQFCFNKDIILIIERKTLDDLASSIKSGRYREQRSRLLSNVNSPSKILYLIEGLLESNKKVQNIPYLTLIGSYVNLLVRDNIKIIQSQNIEETIHFIENIYNKLSKLDSNSKLLNKLPIDTNYDYISNIKSKKKDNLNPYNCFIIQLSQIPGISTILATHIANTHKSFKKLYSYFDEKGEFGLNDLKYINSGGKKVSFGKKRSQLIYNYLYFEN